MVFNHMLGIGPHDTLLLTLLVGTRKAIGHLTLLDSVGSLEELACVHVHRIISESQAKRDTVTVAVRVTRLS